MSDWSRINQTTATWFCETLHCTNYPRPQIVTGWESSIAVLTKIIGQPIFWPKNLKFWL